MKTLFDSQQLDVFQRQTFDVLKYINTRLETTRISYQGLTDFTNQYAVLNQSVGNRKLQNINISTTFGNESITDPNVPEFSFRIGSKLRYEKVLSSANKDPFEVVNYQTLTNMIRGEAGYSDGSKTIGIHTFEKDPAILSSQYVEFKDIDVRLTGLSSITAYSGVVNNVDGINKQSVVNVQYLEDSISSRAQASTVYDIGVRTTALESHQTLIDNHLTSLDFQIESIPTNLNFSQLTSRVYTVEQGLTNLQNLQASNFSTLSNGKISNTGATSYGHYVFGTGATAGSFTVDAVDFTSVNNTSTLGITVFTSAVTVNDTLTAAHLKVTSAPTNDTDAVNLAHFNTNLGNYSIPALEARIQQLENLWAAAFP